MSSILRFRNVPADLTEADVKQLLDESGLSERTESRLEDESGEKVLYVTMPWERHIADAVAKKIDGRMFRGYKIEVGASHLFGG